MTTDVQALIDFAKARYERHTCGCGDCGKCHDARLLSRLIDALEVPQQPCVRCAGTRRIDIDGRKVDCWACVPQAADALAALSSPALSEGQRHLHAASEIESRVKALNYAADRDRVLTVMPSELHRIVLDVLPKFTPPAVVLSSPEARRATSGNVCACGHHAALHDNGPFREQRADPCRVTDCGCAKFTASAKVSR